MSNPKALEPEQGYKYQLLCRHFSDREWEHCDYAKDKIERDYLLKEYFFAYGGFTIKAFILPKKYWYGG
jgi:hypothetical protein